MELDRLAPEGERVSLPLKLYLAMSECYFGHGLRYRELPSQAVVRDSSHQQVTPRPEGGTFDEGKIPDLAAVTIHRTLPGIPRGTAPNAVPRPAVPPKE